MNDRESLTDAAIHLAQSMDPQCRIQTTMEWVRFRFRGLMFCLALAGFGQARVISGRRTFDEQCQLYGLGRSKDELAVIGVSGQYARPDEARVSWIDPRYSRHVKGLAIDIDFREYAIDRLEIVEDLCRVLGITWGGVWSVRDTAHFEL